MTSSTVPTSSTVLPAPRLVDVDLLAAALRGEHPPVVVDVRSPDEFFGSASGHIPGSLLVPLAHLLAELPTLRTIESMLVLTCETGEQALDAAQLLSAAGVVGVAALEGGLQRWRRQGHPVAHDA